MKESSHDDDYVTLLKKDVLTKQQLTNDHYITYKTSTDYMGYYWSGYCHDGDNNRYYYGKNGPYRSEVKPIVEIIILKVK